MGHAVEAGQDYPDGKSMLGPQRFPVHLESKHRRHLPESFEINTAGILERDSYQFVHPRIGPFHEQIYCLRLGPRPRNQRLQERARPFGGRDQTSSDPIPRTLEGYRSTHLGKPLKLIQAEGIRMLHQAPDLDTESSRVNFWYLEMATQKESIRGGDVSFELFERESSNFLNGLSGGNSQLRGLGEHASRKPCSRRQRDGSRRRNKESSSFLIIRFLARDHVGEYPHENSFLL
jgi:hypothetical protein